MSDKNLKNVNDKSASASELSIAESALLYEQEERKKNNRKRLLKFFIMLLFTLLVLILATIAWFAMNKNTDATGMGVTANSSSMMLATLGTDVRNNPPFEDLKPDYNEGETVTLMDQDGISRSFHVTGSSGDLMLRFTPPEDDPSTTDYDESIPEDIGPNSDGELSLYIVPSSDGNIDAYIDLNIIAYTILGTGADAQIIEINEDLTTSSGLTQDKIDECLLAADYLKGHIMFFEEKANNQSYSYRKPVTNHTIHFTYSNAVAGRAYKVPIYWIWPNTLGQIALKTNSRNLRSGKPVVEETSNMGTEASPTDKKLVLDYLKENKDSMFRDLDVEASLTEEEATAYEAMTEEQKAAFVSSKIDDWIDNADELVYFDFLSNGYNTADFTIGTNLDYFLVDVTVTGS